MKTDLVEAVARKGSDKERIAAQALAQPQRIPELIGGLESTAASARYGCEKVLRLVSEKEPQLLYPYFDTFVALMDGDNKFLKWGAIMTIANLAAADKDNRIEEILDRYYAPLSGPVMVTAANIIAGSAKIARAKPALTGRIVREILKAERAPFRMHGAPSPECNRVACQQALATFEEIFDQIEDRAAVLEFAQRQLGSSRPALSRKAERFLRRHGLTPGAGGEESRA